MVARPSPLLALMFLIYLVWRAAMTIEATTLDRNVRIAESPHDTGVHVALNTSKARSASNAPLPVKPAEVSAAVQQLQAAISQSPNPDFKLDYLSGLSVVTVRSSITGEVVFQLPDTRALELA